MPNPESPSEVLFKLERLDPGSPSSSEQIDGAAACGQQDYDESINGEYDFPSAPVGGASLTKCFSTKVIGDVMRFSVLGGSLALALLVSVVAGCGGGTPTAEMSDVDPANLTKVTFDVEGMT